METSNTYSMNAPYPSTPRSHDVSSSCGGMEEEEHVTSYSPVIKVESLCMYYK